MLVNGWCWASDGKDSMTNKRTRVSKGQFAEVLFYWLADELTKEYLRMKIKEISVWTPSITLFMKDSSMGRRKISAGGYQNWGVQDTLTMIML